MKIEPSTTSEKYKSLFFRFFRNISIFGKTKTHDFRKYKEDTDYSIDFQDSYNYAHMITGISVQKGQYIILTDQEQTLKYYAEVVDYYSNSDILREIKLKRVLHRTNEY